MGKLVAVKLILCLEATGTTSLRKIAMGRSDKPLNKHFYVLFNRTKTTLVSFLEQFITCLTV
jgi:hypothetical protein